MLEAGVVVGFEGEPIHWHMPQDRQSVALPDSRDLWKVLWENRAQVFGVAHTHPGSGVPGPSWTDVTTFSAIELGLGRRLVWWIASSDRLVSVIWMGPGKHAYHEALIPGADNSTHRWLDELRSRSVF